MVCHRLKSGIKHAKSIQSHAKFADQYMRHLSGVYADRQTYAQYKWRAIHQRDIVCAIIDSMDRSKFRLPRFPQGRCPKSLETRKRPELEVTAAILHGRAIFVYLTDEDASTGSDWSLEVLSLSLNKAFVMAQQANEPWPAHLRLWTDNTPKDTWQNVSFFVPSKFTFWFRTASHWGISQFDFGSILLPPHNHSYIHDCGPWPFGHRPHSWGCRCLDLLHFFGCFAFKLLFSLVLKFLLAGFPTKTPSLECYPNWFVKVMKKCHLSQGDFSFYYEPQSFWVWLLSENATCKICKANSSRYGFLDEWPAQSNLCKIWDHVPGWVHHQCEELVKYTAKVFYT